MQPSALSESPNSQVILLFTLMKPPTKQHLWAVLKFIFKGSVIVCCWLLTWAKWEDFHADLHRDLYRKEKHVWMKWGCSWFLVGIQRTVRFLGCSTNLSDASHCPGWAQGFRAGALGVQVTADVNSGVCHETELSLITLWGLLVGFLCVPWTLLLSVQNVRNIGCNQG